jgi:hypothetical protein
MTFFIKVSQKTPRPKSSILATQYTLRTYNRDYKQVAGQNAHFAGTEELDCNKTPRENRYINNIQ